jgi:myotubularin-related protein 1/2
MDKVERSAFTATTGGANGANPTTLMGLLLYGKDNGRQLRFTTPSYADTLRALEALQTYAFPGRRNLGYLFAFESKRTAVMDSIVTDETTGKKTVTLEPVRKRFEGVAEFERQFARGDARPWTVWNTVNPSYQTCQSYPAVLAGPATLDEHNPEAQRTIRQCAAFRSEQRLPALTWTSGTDGASLWRCSQPKIGLQGNRSSADELFLKHILESASSANAMARDQAAPSLSRSMLVQLTGSGDVQNWVPEPGCGMKILDLRPRSSAIANRTGGYGYENTSNYAGSTLQFCNIGNIHAVRDSYQKMSALCLSPSTQDVQWNALVEDTKWLSHIRLILSAAWESAFWVHVHRLPVLLHCSHGWDRTSQVAALAELLLDPFYRTREGFSCLIEKDFMSFGHPFHTRCAHGEGRGDAGAPSSGATSSDEGQISPIFLQFLDCVYQIVKLYPECFEFNTKYLMALSEHVYSCRFGNLLCDTERERELVAGIRQRTHSLWDYLDERKDTLNDKFSEATSSGVLLMPLATLLRNVSLWTERHCMHGPKPTDRWLVD